MLLKFNLTSCAIYFKLILYFYFVHSQDLTDVCICDLISEKCEVNCCCDKDCTYSDKLVFVKCLDIPQRDDPQICVNPHSILIDNSGLSQSTMKNSRNLLCIYFDNFEGRNFYSLPEEVTDVDSFLAYKAEYDKTSQNDPLRVGATQTFLYSSKYYANDFILAVSDVNKNLHPFTLPTSAFSQACDASNKIRYLRESLDQCYQTINNLTEFCQLNPFLSASTYYSNFKLLRNPGALFDGFLAGSSLDSTVANLNSSQLLQIQLVTSPNFFTSPEYLSEQETCLGVVSQVNYKLIVNGSTGIVYAQVSFVQSNITNQHLPFKQSFKVEFIWEGTDVNKILLKMSGNPGYIVGEPVMAGRSTSQPISTTTPPSEQIEFEQSSQNAILVDSDPSNWLTVISAVNCHTPEQRKNVKFGYNMQTGCLIKINNTVDLTVCKRLQQEVLAALIGVHLVDRIAGYANASSLKPMDWLPILISNQPSVDSVTSPNPGSCSSIVLGLNIQILYAQTGSVLNPQAKIIGAMFDYASPRDIKLHCLGSFCYPGVGSNENVPVITTVQFIDVSGPFEESLSVIPVIHVSLPTDFFYPFTGNAYGLTYGYILYLCIYLALYIGLCDS